MPSVVPLLIARAEQARNTIFPICQPHSPSLNQSFMKTSTQSINPSTHSFDLLGETEGQLEQILDEAQLLAALEQEAHQLVQAEARGVPPQHGPRLHKAPGGKADHTHTLNTQRWHSVATSAPSSLCGGRGGSTCSAPVDFNLWLSSHTESFIPPHFIPLSGLSSP